MNLRLRRENGLFLVMNGTMPTEQYIDIFAAKERLIRILREMGSQSYSRLLMNSQLPEEVLAKVLELLENEHKVKVERISPSPVGAEPTYQPVSGGWALSGSKT